MSLPSVSVVIGVRNGESTIASTIQSISIQTGIDLEIIIVDDGSSDHTHDILQTLANNDTRIKIIKQSQCGLTKALIQGCRAATGEFIARQDNGDFSLADRLARQALSLQSDPSAVLCSSHVRFMVAEGITSEVRSPSTDDLSDGLTGPAAHGCVMMRRSIYDIVGGYRSAFYYAQDIDLWTRMVEHGKHIVIPEVLYETVISPDSISGSRRREQILFHQIIVEATTARRNGQSEQPWIKEAKKLATYCKTLKRSKIREADGAYFLGSCLLKRDPDLARRYFRRTIELNPRHLRARLRLALKK